MKKFFAVVFIICLALSLIGCGSKPDTDPVVPDSVDVSQTPEEAVAPKPFSEDDTIETREAPMNGWPLLWKNGGRSWI